MFCKRKTGNIEVLVTISQFIRYTGVVARKAGGKAAQATIQKFSKQRFAREGTFSNFQPNRRSQLNSDFAKKSVKLFHVPRVIFEVQYLQPHGLIKR